MNNCSRTDYRDEFIAKSVLEIFNTSPGEGVNTNNSTEDKGIDIRFFIEMSNLGISSPEEIDYLDENTIENIKKKFTNLAELKNQWKKFASTFTSHEWIFRYITPKQEVMIDKYYHMLTDKDTTYTKYKQAFRFFCQFMGLPNNKVILENIVISKNKKDPDKTKLAVKYSKGLVKVYIPDDIRLVHVSPVDNINELIPSFRSKVKGKYMYPSKRVFFTVKGSIRKNQAGLEHQKITTYKTKQNFDTAYIDPTYNTYKDGCVYIETDQPIPVEKMEAKGISKFFKEDVGISSYSDEYLEFVDEVFSKMVKNQFNTNWNTSDSSSTIKKFKNNHISEEEFDKLHNLIKTMRTCETYEEYKPAFDKFCRFCHILPSGTIITTISLKSGSVKDQNSLYVEYSFNNKKIKLNDNQDLYHVSKNGDIEELIPQFRGKSERGYLYDKPRIYVSIYEKLPKIMADYKSGKMYYYKISKSIDSAYVDPLLKHGAQGALYISTSKPIKVEKLNN